MKQTKRRAGHILQELGLVHATPMSTKETINSQPEDDDDNELTSNDGAKHRRLVARLSYIAHDRPDIQCAT